jgi:CheY-like chemotaxis protein
MFHLPGPYHGAALPLPIFRNFLHTKKKRLIVASRQLPNNPAPAHSRTIGLLPAAQAPRRNVPMFKNNLRILLVEDHPFQLIATQILLNNQGYFLLTPALTAREALQEMERAARPYDILLCDQCLPDLMGLALIEQAHRRSLMRNAILLSGLADPQLDDLRRQAMELGLPLLGCLSKPLHGPDLSELIAHLDTAPDVTA